MFLQWKSSTKIHVVRSIMWTFCCLIALCSQVEAGAWTQNAGGYYLKLGANYLNSQGDLDGQGNRVPKVLNGMMKDFNLSAYVEYGLTKETTLVVFVPYKRLSDTRIFPTGIARERRSGMGDLEVRLRQLVINRSSWVGSIAVGAKVPLWYGSEGLSRVPLSSREVDVDSRALLGLSFHPGYATGELGYRYRGGLFSNEIFYSLEAGWSVGPVLLKGLLTGIRTFGHCEAGTGGLVEDQDVLKFVPGVIYRLGKRVELSAELIHVAGGCNTITGNTISFGIAFKR